MNFDVGLLDRMFGKRVTIEVPTANGRTNSVSVTEKWLEQMRREGKMTPATEELVLVHICDSLRGQYDAHWVIGKDIPRQTYEEFYDQQHLAVFAVAVYREGEPQVMVVKKAIYDQAVNL